MSYSAASPGALKRDAAALIRSALAGLLDDANRPIRLRLGKPPDRGAPPLDGLLLVQRVEIHEAVFEGLTAHVTCLSPSAGLPLADFIGLPIEIQLVTDRGGCGASAASSPKPAPANPTAAWPSSSSPAATRSA